MRLKTKISVALVAALLLPVMVAVCVGIAIRHTERFTDDMAASETIADLAHELHSLCHHQHNRLPLDHKDEWLDAAQGLAAALTDGKIREKRVSTASARRALETIDTHMAFMHYRGDGPLPAESGAVMRQHYTNIVTAVDTLCTASSGMKEELYSGYRRMSRIVGLGALGFIGFLALTTGAGVVWGGKRLVRRVNRISDGMRAVADGDLQYKIGLASNDELGAVAAEFDQMTSRLRGTLEHQQNLIRELKMHEMAEEEIHRTQDLTRRWLNDCTDGVWDWHLDDDYEYMSPRFWELFGYDPETKQHHPSAWQEILHKKDLQKVTESFEAHVSSRGETPFREELRFRHKNGHIVWVLSRGQVIEWHDDGTAKRMVGTHTDITRMKEAERRVRETHELLSAVLEQSPDSIFVKELDGNYKLINATGAERYGKSPKDFVGRHSSELFSAEESENMTRSDNEVYASDHACTFEQKLDIVGRRVTMMTTKAPFRNGRGDIIGIIGMSRDISELSAARQTLLQQTEELEKSNRELEQFAYVASHDLQEPLRKISAFSDLLKETDGEKISDDGREFLSFMHSAATRMQGLVRDLLELSRVAMRTQPFEPIALNTVCSDVVNDLEFAIEDAGGHVTIEDLPTIDGDMTQLRQLFQNLIGNAIKFRRDDVPIKVIIGPDPDAAKVAAADHCYIQVKDNGIGFDEKYSERIFGVFQRLHSKQTFPGSGIGLAICRKITERHNGALTVTSVPGEGTTFHIDLPMHQEATTGSGV